MCVHLRMVVFCGATSLILVDTEQMLSKVEFAENKYCFAQFLAEALFVNSNLPESY